MRWWPAAVVLFLGAAAMGVVWLDPSRSHQQRNLTALATAVFVVPLLLAWWGLLSRAPVRARVAGLGGFVGLAALFFSLFRVSGVSGDLKPIFSWRWHGVPPTQQSASPASQPGAAAAASVVRADFPQFLGPERDGHIRGVELATDWEHRPPVELWRRPVGAGWSGFVVSGDRAVTLEQDGGEEVVSAWNVNTGERAWSSRSPGRYATTIAGEGPRSTPLIVGGRVYALGATGTLSCLAMADGRLLWRASLTELARCGVPEWGFASSPAWVDGKVVVLAGGDAAGVDVVALSEQRVMPR
jgi:outer membrane protein assembly factor BamB